jgi:putative protein-disulfide isomerase
MVSARYYTDPVCPWSWGIEPQVRKLMIEFADELAWTFVMGGLGRDLASTALDRQVYAGVVGEWLSAADASDMPFDPLLWSEGPISSSYPACMAVEAAAEQGGDAAYRYLRRLREGLMLERRKLDHAEALVEEARGASLDVERFRIDLRSHAITEAFGADLELTRVLGARLAGGDGAGRSSRGAGDAPLPTLVFSSDDGREASVVGFQPYEAYREAVEAVGGRADAAAPPAVEDLVARFGRVATREVELICALPGPRAGAELYRLAEQWKLRPVKKLSTGFWERA